MTKILLIDDKSKDSLFLKSTKAFLKSRSYIYSGWKPSDFLTSEVPTFILFDLRKSVNGDNLMNITNGFDVYCRLRITVIYPFKLNFVILKESINFIQNIFRRKTKANLKQA